jgi:hypothetical protein
MIDSDNIQKITRQMVKDTFYNYFKVPKKDTRHILLDRVFPDERRISSTMSGLQTSIGLFWERLAAELAEQNGFEVLDKFSLKRPENHSPQLSRLIDRIKTERQNRGGDLTELRRELDNLYSAPYDGVDVFIPIQKGKGADLILKKNNIIYIYDIKTVQVNANNGNSLNETVILWIAYYKYQHRVPANNIQAMLVFPYNSADENNDQTWWANFGGRISPLTRHEVVVGNEFWSFITGNQNALSAMITGFEDVSADANFTNFYKQVFSCRNELELKEFALKVKFRRAEENHNIKLALGQQFDTRRLLNWVHINNNVDCTFKSRLNFLLENNQHICPECNNQLGVVHA